MWWTFSWIVRKRWWFRVPKSLYIIESLLSWERLTEAVVILKCSICVTRSMVLYSSGSWELNFARFSFYSISSNKGDTDNCSQYLSISCLAFPLSCFMFFSSKAWKYASYSFHSLSIFSLLYYTTSCSNQVAYMSAWIF